MNKPLFVGKFDLFEEIKANYSVENYNKILSIKDVAIQNLTSALNKSECDSIVTSAINEALLVNDLLDDEKENALSSLLSLLEELKKTSPLYSSANFAKIEGYYDEAKLEIAKINEIANIALVKQTLSKYVSLIKASTRIAFTQVVMHTIFPAPNYNIPPITIIQTDYTEASICPIAL